MVINEHTEHITGIKVLKIELGGSLDIIVNVRQVSTESYLQAFEQINTFLPSRGDEKLN